MENASEALIMAAAVLLFVLGLSVVMVEFNVVKTGIDQIVSNADRENKYVSSISSDEKQYNAYIEKYITNANHVTVAHGGRLVDYDTVIESLYRSTNELTRIQFAFVKDSILSDRAGGAERDESFKWLEVKRNELNTLSDTNDNKKYYSNSFHVSMVNNLSAKTMDSIMYMQYLLTSTQSKKIDGTPPSSVDKRRVDSMHSGVTTNLYTKLKNAKAIEEVQGMYTEGLLTNSEANMKEVKVITYYVYSN